MDLSINTPATFKEKFEISRRPFLRRTVSTSPPLESSDSESKANVSEVSTTTEPQKTRKKTASTENAAKRRPPYLNGSSARSERPSRLYTRRRYGGANATKSTTTPTPSSSSTIATLSSRKPVRVVNRRRPVIQRNRITSTTPKPATVKTRSTTVAPSTIASVTTAAKSTLYSEEDFDLPDFTEHPLDEDINIPSSREPTKTIKIQRRPTLILKEEDQNPSATNEDESKKAKKTPLSEEKKRDGKKYSSKIKQNQLDEVLKLISEAQSDLGEIDGVTTVSPKQTTVEDFSAETALAIAAHQLLTAPLPVEQNYDEGKPKKKSSVSTTQSYKYTSPYTEQYSDSRSFGDYSSTPAPHYHTTRAQDYVQTSSPAEYGFSPVYDIPKTTTYIAPKTSSYPTNFYTNKFSSKPSVYSTTVYPIDISPNSISTTVDSFRDGDYSSPSQAIDYSSRNPDYPRGTEFSTGPTKNSDYTRDYSSTYVDDFPRGHQTYSSVSQLSSTTLRPSSNDYSSSPVYTEFPRGRQTYSGVSIQSSSTVSPILSDVSSTVGSSTARYLGGKKLIPVPVEDYSLPPETYSSVSQEPAYFTREYLLESPVTKVYDEEYQYLSPNTTPSPQTTTTVSPTTTRLRIKPIMKQNRRISTTITPMENVVIITSPKPKTTRKKTPAKKIDAHKMVIDYGLYEGGETTGTGTGVFEDDAKVILRETGSIECLDVGNFPHPSSCKKFISCARLENGSLLGWEYECPEGLSFDPVGGICNWAPGLGCDEATK